MAIQEVGHIADVSFKNYFLGEDGKAPVDGKIKVNGNTFDVTFEDGRVKAKFSSGNWFTNMFRGGTKNRFIHTLQDQYDSWHTEQVRIANEAARRLEKTLGFEDNENAPKVAAVVDDLKAAVEAANPPDKETCLARLDDIAKLAAVRNKLTEIDNGEECDEMVRFAGFMTHYDTNTTKLDDKGKKGYVLNMLDTVINGFLEAAGKMTDKGTQAVEFLRGFNGACVEAKGDNIQEYILKSEGLVQGARSDESHDLAYSVMAEFAVLAEEVRRPYTEAAVKECEAGVREDCAKKGITDEADIKRRIETKAAMIVIGKDAEIKKKLRSTLESEGKFPLYANLAGAKRPVTEITKDETTGKWVVTTLVDANNKPILKPVSAFDVDKNFAMLVDMCVNDAMEEGLIEHRTRVAPDVTLATREDMRADGVLDVAQQYAGDDADIAEFAAQVKAAMSFKTELPDNEFNAKVKEAIADVLATKKDDPAEAKKQFEDFALNYADASYFDKLNDKDRLIHLVKNRVETLVDEKQKYLADLDAKATRCAMMMRKAYPDMKVYVLDAKQYIMTAIERMVKAKYGKDPKGSEVATRGLNSIMPNGKLFSDSINYEMGHRAGGRREVRLHEELRVLMNCLKIFASAHPRYYMKEIH